MTTNDKFLTKFSLLFQKIIDSDNEIDLREILPVNEQLLLRFWVVLCYGLTFFFLLESFWLDLRMCKIRIDVICQDPHVFACSDGFPV